MNKIGFKSTPMTVEGIKSRIERIKELYKAGTRVGHYFAEIEEAAIRYEFAVHIAEHGDTGCAMEMAELVLETYRIKYRLSIPRLTDVIHSGN